MKGGGTPTVDPAASLACPHTQTRRYTLTGVNSNPGYKDDPVRTAEGCWESLQTQMLQHPMTNTASVMCYNENVAPINTYGAMHSGISVPLRRAKHMLQQWNP